MSTQLRQESAERGFERVWIQIFRFRIISSKKNTTETLLPESAGERAQRASKGLTREQLEPPSSHRQAPEKQLDLPLSHGQPSPNSWHHRGATRITQHARRHTVETTDLYDSAFRFLSK